MIFCMLDICLKKMLRKIWKFGKNSWGESWHLALNLSQKWWKMVKNVVQKDRLLYIVLSRKGALIHLDEKFGRKKSIFTLKNYFDFIWKTLGNTGGSMLKAWLKVNIYHFLFNVFITWNWWVDSWTQSLCEYLNIVQFMDFPRNFVQQWKINQFVYTQVYAILFV